MMRYTHQVNQQDTIPPLPKFPRHAAHFTLIIERVWPAFFRIFVGLALLLSFTFLGGWLVLSPSAHAVLLTLICVGLTWVLISDIKYLEWPLHAEALKRLEDDNNLQHQPLQSLEDTPFSGSTNLWHAHKQRSRTQASRLKISPPVATIDQRDPLCVRYLALFAVLVSGLIAGPTGKEKLLAIKPPPLIESSPPSATIWLEAPAYTSRAPLTLWSSDTPSPTLGLTPDAPLFIPVHSTIEIRLSSQKTPWWRTPRVTIQGASSRKRYKFNDSETGTGPSNSVSHPITEALQLTAFLGDKTQVWHLSPTADSPPKIHLQQPITINDENTIEIRVEIKDDYGILNGIARLKLEENQSLPLDTPPIDPQIAQQPIDIALPFIQGKSGLRSQTLDLQRHPWAGLKVALSIGGCDGAGQCNFTKAQSITLPHKAFYNPLAKTVIAERKTLAIAPESRERTQKTIAAITTAPALYFDEAREYLLLRSAFWHLSADNAHPSSRLIDDFWELALHLEDDALAIARKALDDAQAALRDAIKTGADAAIIKQLTESLRQKIQAYVEALAQSGAADHDPTEHPGTLGDGEIDKILDQINDLTNAGADAAAAQLLAELEKMLQNIQLSRSGTAEGQETTGQQPGGQGQPGKGTPGDVSPQQRALNAAGNLIAEQREIADTTFNAARAQYGLDTPSDAQSGTQLGRKQTSLAQQTTRLKAQLSRPPTEQNSDTPPSGSPPPSVAAELTDTATRSLETATNHMRTAAQFLKNENFAAAAQAQDEAITALRDGAIALSKASAATIADDTANDDTETQGTAAAQGHSEGVPGALNDPLGRVYIPDPNAKEVLLNLSDPTRARALIEKIRERLTSGTLSQEERDYLQRLLERFTPTP